MQWTATSDATRYDVLVSLVDGRRIERVVNELDHALELANLPTLTKGTVLVTAQLLDGTPGPAATTRFGYEDDGGWVRSFAIGLVLVLLVLTSYALIRYRPWRGRISRSWK